jgi:peptide/nickel transport system permease protein
MAESGALVEVGATERGLTASRPSGPLPALGRFARSSRVGAACALLLVLIGLLALLADVIAPYDPLAGNYSQTRHPPSAEHLLGTDHLGRDVASRVLYGARVTILVAVSSVVIGETLGFFWGLTSGYIGRRFDLVSQRVLEVLMSFPTLILAMLLLIGLGAGLQTVIVAIAVTRIPGSARIVRSVVLAVKELAYVDAARCLGESNRRIMFRHVAP